MRTVARLRWCSATIAIALAQPIHALAANADTIWYGGPIVTVNDRAPSAGAVAVKDGKIVKVGTKNAVLQAERGPATEFRDLGGRTLVPGFIDPHSHFIDALSLADRVNVSAPPVGPAKDVEEIVATLRAAAKARGLKPGELLVGYGYDENLMPGGQELSREVLDEAFPDNPVAIIHVSMHGAVLNSRAFEKCGYQDRMPTPPGGIIARKPGTQDLASLVMEAAYLNMFANLPLPTPDTEMAAAKAGQMLYAAAGITTAQDGATQANQVAQLKRIAKRGGLFLDVVAYPFFLDLDEVLERSPASSFGVYDNHLKLGGCKITADGSPQGKTAWFTTPYLTRGPAGEEDWSGEPNLPLDAMLAGMKKCYDNGLQVLFHANGDAAIDFLFRAHEQAVGNGDRAADRRPARAASAVRAPGRRVQGA